MFAPTTLQIFGWLAGGLSALCYVPYIYGIVKHKVRPERASWFIWSALTGITFFSNLAIGATHSLWLPGIQGVGVIIVFLLSIKRGYGGLLLRDVVMLAAASITLALWHFTKQPVIAAYLTTLISAMGGYLTVVKAYEQPNTEAPSTWAMSGAAGLFAALSVGRLNLALLAYPFYIFFVNNAVLIAILLGTRRAR